jgi:signal transduction histidine kinase
MIGMNKAPWKNTAARYGAFPIGAFFIIVLLVCALLAASSVYGYFTLLRLRTEYLQNLGHDVAAAIDAQARGPGRRHNPEFWRELIEDHFGASNPSLAYIALVDQSDSVLAGKSIMEGTISAHPPGFAVVDESRIFVFDLPLTAVNRGQAGIPSQVAGWRLQIGLYTAPADFIQRHAITQVAATSVAIIALLALAYFFLQNLRRFVKLQNQEQSERHLKALGTMSAALAHEIRNPLGAIKGLTQLVQEDLSKEHNAHTLMKTVVNEAERLEGLVSDLLNFSRPRRHTLSRFDYADLLADVQAMLESRLQEAGKTLEARTAGPMMIYSDKDGMSQVLLNVLLNAVDATPNGGKIVVHAALDGSSKNVVTNIDDQGFGLGDRDPETLFEPFATTKTKGTGLGLAISRQIINNLGGTIRLENLPGGGARCSIRIPAGKEKHR